MWFAGYCGVIFRGRCRKPLFFPNLPPLVHKTAAGNYRLSHRSLTILIFARPSARGAVSLLFGFDRDKIAREALKSHVCPSLVR
jgi:hypothetical protein